MEDIRKLTFDDRDEFHRKAIAEKVIALLSSDIDISPMIIDGSWGSGKTEFCCKLINLINESKDYQTVYVDAFEADHADEPLLSVFSEVLKLLPEGEKRDGAIKKALPAIRFGLKTLAKAGAGHILRQDATDVVDEFDKEFKQAADKAIDATVESLLKDHVKASESLSKLQGVLREIVEDKPLILFIDELDRCRPDFAVKMLETVKHTFEIGRVQFVLVTNTNQLKAAVNHCYGPTVDSQRYLDKFVKYSFELVDKQETRYSDDEHESAVLHYLLLVNKSQFLKDTGINTDPLFNIVKHMIIVNALSLREVETVIRNLEIYQFFNKNRALGNIQIGYKALRMIGVFLFSLKPKLAIGFLNDQVDSQELENFFGLDISRMLTESYDITRSYELIMAILLEGLMTTEDNFSPSVENLVTQWKDHLRGYFNTGYPDNRKQFDAVAGAIRTLSLRA